MTCYIYILSSRSRALYIGVTNDLQRRLFEHRNPTSLTGHTARYRINRLVYFEIAEPHTSPLLGRNNSRDGSAQGKLR